MMIHLELLRERLGGAPGEVQEDLESIVSAIRRLDRVVQGFLRFLRPQELNLKPVDLNAVLRDMVALLEAEWGPRACGSRSKPSRRSPPSRAIRSSSTRR